MGKNHTGKPTCNVLSIGRPSLVVAPSIVTVRHDRHDGCYTAELRGHFRLTMADDDPFRLQMFIRALRSPDDDSTPRAGRRTWDGRTPLVRQQMPVEVMGIPQPDISRWRASVGDGPFPSSLHRRLSQTRDLTPTALQPFADGGIIVMATTLTS